MTQLAADSFRTVDPASAIANDAVLPYYLRDLKRRISIARVDDRLYAFDDLCTCTGEPCPLSGGLLTGTTLMCQCHGSRFDITTGTVLNGPATEALNVYEVREIDGDIQMSVSTTDEIREVPVGACGDEQRGQRRLALVATLILVFLLITVAARVKRLAA